MAGTVSSTTQSSSMAAKFFQMQMRYHIGRSLVRRSILCLLSSSTLLFLLIGNLRPSANVGKRDVAFSKIARAGSGFERRHRQLKQSGFTGELFRQRFRKKGERMYNHDSIDKIRKRKPRPRRDEYDDDEDRYIEDEFGNVYQTQAVDEEDYGEETEEYQASFEKFRNRGPSFEEDLDEETGEEQVAFTELRKRCVRPWSQLLSKCRTHKKESISVVVLCGAAPGNIGAALRSAAVLGIAAVCVLGMGTKRDDLKQALRVSQIDRRPQWKTKLVPVPDDLTPCEALSTLRDEAGLSLVGLTAEGGGSKPLWEVDLARPRLALVFGSDSDDGIAFPQGSGKELEVAATIPMPTPDDMLNLSNTVAAVCYERHRQVHQKSMT
eukprot:TRINITY_DN50456_c0_g1_i1.p1 TRINITY_DN50456_c0_g1~~TRINITY_DN50456_c0_g1_i1.p1  ORF type:complete len:380 (-),score=61.43 TRINITY_DN50456_c0_g1_i1:85-1224(-)